MTRPYDRRAWRRSRPHGPCAWCGGPATEWDHLVPIARGGSALDPANLVPSCRACNRRRGAITAQERRLGAPSRRW